MKTIYIDSEFKCHLVNDGSFQEVETDLFDAKCDHYVEGYRFVPTGETWTRSDGEVFVGEMITPWKSFDELQAAQLAYELAEYESLVNELYAEVTAE